MKKHTGKCLCGAIAYEINGEIGTIINCHCAKCRRWHAAPFRTRAAIKSKDFKWTQGEEHLSKYHSSEDTVKTFCAICGSGLISIMESDPEYYGLPIGGLDQDPGNRPEMHIFVGSKSPWYEILDDLPQYDGWPNDSDDFVRGVED